MSKVVDTILAFSILIGSALYLLLLIYIYLTFSVTHTDSLDIWSRQISFNVTALFYESAICPAGDRAVRKQDRGCRGNSDAIFPAS